MTFATVGTAILGSVASNVIGSAMGGNTGQQASQVADPFQQSRVTYGNELNQYMANPSQYTQQQPGYQFNYQQGLGALQNQFAAGGMSASGNALAGAEQYGQNYAMNQSSNLFNELAQLSGASWQSGGNAANALISGNQQSYNQGAQIGSGITGAMNQYVSQNQNSMSNLFNYGSGYNNASPADVASSMQWLNDPTAGLVSTFAPGGTSS